MFKTQKSRNNDIVLFLLVYGLCHALIDASCAFLVLGAIYVKADLWLYIVLYNALAFCLQVPFGILLDKYSQPKVAAIIGMLCVLVAYFFLSSPMMAVVLAGIGNALFHVGGGQVVLNINFRKATYPGIFVAPGGIGLALGIYLSVSHAVFNLLLFPFLLLIMTVVLFITKIPAFSLVT
jgi:FSR family fosmidomycin resistance protein-like MFS transporter